MKIKLKNLIQYSILAFPLAFSGLPLFVYAPDFYISQYGISLELIGIILLVIRSMDAIQDPFIGKICDRYVDYRIFILGISLVLLGTGFFMLYYPPYLMGPVVWFTVCMVLLSFSFSFLSINFNSIGSLWGQNDNEKTSITTARESISLLGLLCATIIPSVLSVQNLSQSEVYRMYTLIFLVSLFLGGLIFLRWFKLQNFKVKPLNFKPAYFNFKPVFQPTFKVFFFAYGISMLASSIPAVLVVFFIRDRLGAESLTGLFLLIYFSVGIVGMPLWKYASKKIGVYRSWFFSMVLALIVFVGAFLLEQGDLWAYGIICGFSGLALSAELALPPVVLSNLIEKNNFEGETSTFFAVMGFLTKAALAIATGLSYLVLGLAGFMPNENNSLQALVILSGLYAIVPCILKGLAATMVWKDLRINGDVI